MAKHETREHYDPQTRGGTTRKVHVIAPRSSPIPKFLHLYSIICTSEGHTDRVIMLNLIVQGLIPSIALGWAVRRLFAKTDLDNVPGPEPESFFTDSTVSSSAKVSHPRKLTNTLQAKLANGSQEASYWRPSALDVNPNGDV
ncbi:hypothetical protein H0H87_010723 [Tephrocybe sp. NHM501043]|nr:hypothetical protein H0H87_010723 [Tephrocybe sp. NHM501043]